MATHITATAYLAIGDPNVQTFLNRFGSDGWRTFWCILVLVVVAVVVGDSIGGSEGFAAGLGCWWFTWEVYNSLTGAATPLFVGARHPSDLSEFFGDHLFPWLALILGLFAGWNIFHHGVSGARYRRYGLALRSLAALGTVTFVLMLYGLIFIELDVLGGVHWSHGNWV